MSYLMSHDGKRRVSTASLMARAERLLRGSHMTPEEVRRGLAENRRWLEGHGYRR